MRTYTLLAMLVGFGLMGCQTSGLTKYQKESIERERLMGKAAIKKTRVQKRRAGKRGLDQFSLYDRGELDRKLLRRGQKNRFRR